jgi:two-component system sensor histidine kinase UhpB
LNSKDIPIVILTGVDDYSVGREAWALGVKDFLIKDEIQTQDLSRALRFASHDSLKKSSFA